MIASTEQLPSIEHHRVQPRGRRFAVVANGLLQHTLVYGRDDDPALLIAPGITSPAITWEFVAERLAVARCVIVLDLRGRGSSDTPPSGFGMDDYAGDVAAFIDVTGLHRPALLGHSMGARIVVALAARHPGSHGPLVVVDPPTSGPGRRPYPFPLRVYVDSVRRARHGITVDEVRAVYPTWPERELEIRADWLATCDEQAVVDSYQRFHDEDFFSSWSSCPRPTLFVYGEESPVVTASDVAEVRNRNPSAEVIGIPAAGHMVPWENLDGFVSATTSFLDRVQVAS